MDSLLKHILLAGNEHSLHSPFLFSFYTEVVKSDSVPAKSEVIEQLRSKLKKDKRTIEITDFGAGSRIYKSNLRSIASIAKTSEKPLKWQLILYRILKNYFQNATVVELGTSLGITTAYLATANPGNKIITFEGCPKIAAVAENNFEVLQLKNVSQIIGNIDETLPDFLKNTSKVDLVFFDANHRYEPTMRYFELCIEKANEDSIFIFDDIYWSNEMRQAWEEIKEHEAVLQTLDFYQIGIVMFRKSQPKQHFKLRV
ncbi:MAG: class I SAM-dependent methyltransferase [Spirosomaceae bacterium]|nr:class I SAM-dependent methyltransferase [Spirosomataceae bacterium]